jgi:hypothetical protein
MRRALSSNTRRPAWCVPSPVSGKPPDAARDGSDVVTDDARAEVEPRHQVRLLEDLKRGRRLVGVLEVAERYVVSI